MAESEPQLTNGRHHPVCRTIGLRPFLAEGYCEVPYSYGRRLVVKALSSHAACGAAEELLAEALWDCESDFPRSVSYFL